MSLSGGGEVGRLSVTVTADTSPMERKIRSDANDIGDRHGRSFGQKFGMAAGIGVGAIAGGVGIAAAGVGALTAGMFQMAQAGQESVQVGQTTAAILKSTGATAWTSAAGVDALATALSNKTGVDDEAIATGANLLLTFKQVQNAAGEGGAIFDRATAAAVDLSKAGFGSIDSASKMLGKALNDPIKGVTALSRAGVTFTDQQKDQIKTLVESGKSLEAQKLIMQEVESQVGGVAEATRSPIEALQTVFGNLQEGIGKALLPAITKLADLLIPVLDDLQAPLAAVAGTIGTALVGALEAATPLLGPMAQLFGSLAQLLAGVLTSALTALVPVFEALWPVLGKVAEAFGQGLQKVIEALAPSLPPLAESLAAIALALIPIIPLAADLLVAFAPLVEVVAQLVAEMAPMLAQFIQGAVDSGVLQAAIGLISGAVLILVPLIKDMGDKWVAIQGILTKVWDAIFKAVKPVMDWITNTVVPAMKAFATRLSENFTQAKDSATEAWAGIQAAIKVFTDWFGGVVQSVKDVLAKIASAWDGAKRKVETVWDGIVEYLTGIVDTFVGIGGDIVEGLKRGIANAWGSLTGWFTDKVGGLISGAKGVLGISSPSKVFVGIGSNVVDGFKIGLAPMSNAITDAMGTPSAGGWDGAALRPYSSTELSRVYAPMREGTLSAPTVQVFIGERELTDIVDVRIGESDARSLDYVRSGRRL